MKLVQRVWLSVLAISCFGISGGPSTWLQGGPTGVQGGEIACHAIRFIFGNKNLDTSEVPRSPRQGMLYKILQILAEL